MKEEYSDGRVVKDLSQLPPVRRAKPPKRMEAPKSPTKAQLIPWALRTVLKQTLRPVRDMAKEYPEATVAHMDGHWSYLATLDSAIVSNADGTGASWYRRDPAQVRELMAESTRLHAELLSRWDELSEQYRAALPEITSVQAWARTFAENGTAQ